MKNRSQWLMVLSIAGLVSVGYGGAFKMKEADHKLLLERGILEWDLFSNGLQPLRSPVKAPEGILEPKVKAYFSSTGAAPMLLLFKSNKESKMTDRVIVDENGNRDFTDDPVLTLDPARPLDVKWKPKGREAVDYRIYIVPSKQGNNGNVAFLPMLWREGTVTLEGKPIQALLQSNWMQKTLFLDRDGDGKFNFNSRDDQLQLATYMKIKDSFYKTVVGPSEEDLSLEPFTGPFGKLELTGELVVAGSPGVVNMMLMSTEVTKNRSVPTGFFVKTALTNQPIVVPAGEYTIRNAHIEHAGDKAKSIAFRMDKKIAFSPEQVTKIILDQPKTELAVTQKGRQLTVKRQTVSTGTQGITYSLGRDKEPLVVDVVDPSDPAKVLIGRKNMEYG